MKIVSMLLCLCFTLNVFAASNLEEVYSDYQYAMTVEWDQKDVEFKKVQTELFYANLEALNVTPAELVKFVSTKISNREALAHLETQATQAKSTEELMKIVNTSDLYSQGASWSGRTILTGAAIVTVAALFVYSVYFSVKYGCMESVDGGKYEPCGR